MNNATIKFHEKLKLAMKTLLHAVNRKHMKRILLIKILPKYRLESEYQ